ncbi:hypothetical protein KHC17_01115 [Agrobacterium salinitolerans]|uniref:hypothetical protein n=1 Tax=Agrobacterium salinitolerans TaxID=1183413 RepID=UPI001C2102CE|nr:hypothetical protein [Agrobacterium salinitolerans]QXC49493.1 hypothetical protein KHC17_01115 [Agrobacterium salinitolerans]
MISVIFALCALAATLSACRYFAAKALLVESEIDKAIARRFESSGKVIELAKPWRSRLSQTGIPDRMSHAIWHFVPTLNWKEFIGGLFHIRTFRSATDVVGHPWMD